MTELLYVTEHKLGNEDTIVYLLPPGGGSSLMFSEWKSWHPNVRFRAIEYAGHGRRVSEEPFVRLEDVANDVLSMIGHEPHRYILFGHSFGGLLAHTICDLLTNIGGTLPVHVVISAASPPHELVLASAECMTDLEVLEHIVSQNIVSRRLLNGKAAREYYGRVLVADYRALRSKRWGIPRQSTVPVSLVCSGDDHLVSMEQMYRWKQWYANVAGVFLVGNCGHNYVEPKADWLSRVLTAIAVGNILSGTKYAVS